MLCKNCENKDMCHTYVRTNENMYGCTSGECLSCCPLCGHFVHLETMKVRNGYEAVIRCNGCLLNLPSITFDMEEQAIQSVILQWNKNKF